MWNDLGLQHDVENEVGWELNGSLSKISVAVKNGAVELGGHVDSFWEKCAAQNAAWRVAHVNRVTNEIRVVIPFANQKEDDDIAIAAMSYLEWNSQVPQTVEVQVAQGWVTLSGSVERQSQKEEASRALCALIGIVGIHNNIVIQPAASQGDAKALIEAALRRNALHPHGSIAVRDVNGRPHFVVVENHSRAKVDADELCRSVHHIARHADKVEEFLTGRDVH